MNQPNLSNPLKEYFLQNKARRIIKWVHYFDIYHQYFSQYRSLPVSILEFGVADGGSLQMWKHYFGKQARVIGVDIDKRCKNFIEDRIEIHIGDHGNSNFLKKLIEQTGALDIVIDDGGHFMNQQITTFQKMFPAIKKKGFYITEDLHTSYWKEFGGGYKKRGTFMEYSKDLIDQIHARHSHDLRLRVNDITHTLKSIHFYDSMIVFEKDEVGMSHSERTGTIGFNR